MSRSSIKKARLTGVICLLPNGTIIRIERDEAKHLCNTGHAKWKRSNLIVVLRNIYGPGLSLKVGAGIATAVEEKQPWARSAVQLIFRKK